MNLFNKHETRLIKGCKDNDRLAQEGLYKLFFPEMMRLCCRYLKSDDLAKEAVNAGFLKTFQNIGSFDLKRGQLGAWIHTIMVRTCIDLSRREVKFMRAAGDEEEMQTAFITPDVLDKLHTEDLLKAIRELPAATQLVFNLSVIDGYNHKEIGEQLLITESTSRWHLTQAKKLLREMLKPANSIVNDPTENKIKRK